MEKQPRRTIIFSMKVAGLLMRRGHTLIERKPNIHKPEFDVFVFYKTPQFQQDLNELFEEIKEENK